MANFNVKLPPKARTLEMFSWVRPCIRSSILVSWMAPRIEFLDCVALEMQHNGSC